MISPQTTTRHNEVDSLGPEWPRVPQIAGEEFQQSLAVAQLAAQLCALKREQLRAGEPSRANSLKPESFLSEAWALIQSARAVVLRDQTDSEFFLRSMESGAANQEALTAIVARRRQQLHKKQPTVLFAQLCNKGNAGSLETIYETSWRVYASERGFDRLFWAYWGGIGEMWKDAQQNNKRVEMWRDPQNNKRVEFFSKAEVADYAFVASSANAWKERGKSLLGSWKRDGVPLGDFLRLAKFRRERDNRSANLKKSKPKPKRGKQATARNAITDGITKKQGR